MSAVATLIGDMNMLWMCIFLSFFGPTMLMKKEGKVAAESSTSTNSNNNNNNNPADHTAGDV